MKMDLMVAACMHRATVQRRHVLKRLDSPVLSYEISGEQDTKFLAITSRNMCNQFSKFSHWQGHCKICNKFVLRHNIFHHT